ncbi:MAG: hypothetical protein ABIT09_07745 [Croceibacterium sp.]
MEDGRRRIPPPWRVVGNENCFWIEDAEGKRLANCYFEREGGPTGGSSAIKLTRDEARRIVRGISKLPELIKPKAS